MAVDSPDQFSIESGGGIGRGGGCWTGPSVWVSCLAVAWWPGAHLVCWALVAWSRYADGCVPCCIGGASAGSGPARLVPVGIRVGTDRLYGAGGLAWGRLSESGWCWCVVDVGGTGVGVCRLWCLGGVGGC